MYLTSAPLTRILGAEEGGKTQEDVVNHIFMPKSFERRASLKRAVAYVEVHAGTMHSMPCRYRLTAEASTVSLLHCHIAIYWLIWTTTP